MSSLRSFIIDTDGGVDDAIAIIAALNTKDIDLKAITTVSGNTDVLQATKNVQRLLDYFSSDQSIDLAQGAQKPLHFPLQMAGSIHGKDGLGELDTFVKPDGSAKYPSVSVKPHTVFAPDLILQYAKELGSDLNIICIGPLTNIAIAVEKNREVMQSVGQITIMGGAFYVPGNISPGAEFNFFVDPHAAQLVMEAGLNPVLVGLDVCTKMPLSRELLTFWRSQKQSAITEFLLDCTGIYMKFYQTAENFYGCYLHDPLAVEIAFSHDLGSYKHLFVGVEKMSSLTRGLSLTDSRARRDTIQYPPNAMVCIDIDHKKIMEGLTQKLVGSS